MCPSSLFSLDMTLSTSIVGLKQLKILRYISTLTNKITIFYEIHVSNSFYIPLTPYFFSILSCPVWAQTTSRYENSLLKLSPWTLHKAITKKCLNVRQKLGTRSHSLTLSQSLIHSLSSYWTTFVFMSMLKSHSHNLSLSH